jgi:hypothetical protein
VRLLAIIAEPQSAARFLRHRGEPTEPPARARSRDPPYFKSLVVRRHPGGETAPQRAVGGALSYRPAFKPQGGALR